MLWIRERGTEVQVSQRFFYNYHPPRFSWAAIGNENVISKMHPLRDRQARINWLKPPKAHQITERDNVKTYFLCVFHARTITSNELRRHRTVEDISLKN